MKNRYIRRKVSAFGFSLVTILAIFALMPSTQAVYEKTYTSDVDFDEGIFVGVEHDTVHDQLQLSKKQTTLPFIWVPNSPIGTVSKVNTETGNELGRYIVAPPGVSASNGNPSRTTVDIKGNVWVGNREAGTVVKIGLYENGQCKDRNGDGTIQTSLDTNNDGDITGAELLPWGTDECVLYEVSLIPGKEGTFVPGTTHPAGFYDTNYWSTAPRGLAVDRDNNLWAGTSTTYRMFYINGETGEILKNVAVPAWGNGAYGAVIDRNGKVWISVLGTGVRKFDPSTDTIIQDIPLDHTYGIGLDYEGNLLVGGRGATSKINTSNGTILWTKSSFANQGIAATSDNNIWLAGDKAFRYDKDGNWIASIPNSTYFSITGVAVDAAGKVWGTEYTEWIRRVNPATNTIDLSKRLIGTGFHYSYSDMTGIIARTITTKIGTWTADFDSEAYSKWGALSWNKSEPPAASITIQVRSSNDKKSWSEWEIPTNGVPLSSTPDGRYLQIETTFQSNGDEMPILYDITSNVINQEPLPSPTPTSPTPTPPISQIVAEAGGPYTVYEGVPKTINAIGSSGPPGDILTYEWNFGFNKFMGFEITQIPRDGPSSRTIVLNVSNGKGGFGTDTALWNVNNVNPIVNAGQDQTLYEGDTANFAASFSDVQLDMNKSTAQIDYGDGIFENVIANPNGTIYSSHVYTNSGIYTVTVLVTDKDGGVGSDKLIVTVNGVLPIAEAGGPYTVYEGIPKTINASGSYDPSGGILTYAWDFNRDGIYEIPGFEIIRTPRDGPNTRIIGLQVTNTKGLVSIDTATWNVMNINPIVNAGPDRTLDEGDTANFAANFSDVQLDMNESSAQINYGDGIIENVTANPNGTILGSHKYADNGIYTVVTTVTDKDGGIGSDTLTVTVNNVNPVVSQITSPIDPQSITTKISIGSQFNDVGILDTHVATLDWDDGTTSVGTVTESGGYGSISADHIYSTPGIYNVKLTVTDKDGGTGTATSQLIVVYDPDGGFVTGGGWIDSPAGAYVADPALTGKANFGFVSKYQKGANTPTGQTEFQFNAGGLNFHSANYEWLVVAGPKAQYKGNGTINGAGNYGFLLTATDEQINGGGGIDKFRIKIVDKTTDSAVYDNVIGTSENIDAANPQTIAGGSIVIHK